MVQIYVGDAEASLSRPLRELKAFRKIELNPGQTRELCFELPPRAFAFFDKGTRCWRVEAGEFTIFPGFSAGDLRTFDMVTLPGCMRRSLSAVASPKQMQQSIQLWLRHIATLRVAVSLYRL